MRILAIDTALGACAACVLSGQAAAPLAMESIPLERGHAEALLPLLDRVVARAGSGFEELDRVVVTVGPGSYTGLRIGISAARAIGLAAGIPVVGVTTLSALMAPLVEVGAGRLLVAAIDAKHGHVYVQAVSAAGQIVVPPALLAINDVVRAMGTVSATIVGSGAPMLAKQAWNAGADARVHEAPPVPDIVWVARLGLAADPAEALPKPLYLRGPDARPQDQARLARR